MRKEPLKVKDVDKIVPIGQKIEIFVREGDFEGVYSSYIYDLDTDYIYLLTPTNHNGLKAYIRKNELFDVSFIDKNEKRIGFSTTLVSIEEKDEKIIYKISKPKEIFYRIELRENFRVDILAEADILYFKLSIPQKAKATIIDISAGGAKLSASMKLSANLNINDAVFLTFELEDGMRFENIKAKIVRKALAKENKINHYGLQFVEIDKPLREKMIKFCLNKQIEFVRKMRGLM